MTVRLRPATSADLPAIIALEEECYSDPWPASAFATLPDNNQVYFVVAADPHDARAIHGYAVAWYVLDEGELANLAVATAQREQGIGRELLRAVLEDASARRTATLYLEVRESNVAARALYASTQFVEVGRRKRYYRNPVEDALILRRTLKP